MRTPSDQQTLFQIRGIPPLGSAVSLSLQHLVAMIVGCVTPPIIIAGAIGLSPADQVLLIQPSLVMSAVCTLIQLYPGDTHLSGVDAHMDSCAISLLSLDSFNVDDVSLFVHLDHLANLLAFGSVREQPELRHPSEWA